MPAAGTNLTIKCISSGIRIIKSKTLGDAGHVRYRKYGRDDK
jgi:hypothetical protein